MKNGLKLWQIALVAVVAGFIGIKLGLRQNQNKETNNKEDSAEIITVTPSPPDKGVSSQPSSQKSSPPPSAPKGPLEALATAASSILKQADASTLQVTRISAEEEAEIGAKLHRMRMKEWKMATSDSRRGIVQKTIQRLDEKRTNPTTTLKAAIVESRDINASAGPGGYIYITTGFLDRFPKESHIAMVLAHEIGHIDLLHLRRKVQIGYRGQKVFGDLTGNMMQAVYTQISTPYQRDEEFQADDFGFDLAQRAGWAKADLLGVLIEMEKDQARMQPNAGKSQSPLTVGIESMLATHPGISERRKRLEAR